MGKSKPLAKQATLVKKGTDGQVPSIQAVNKIILSTFYMAGTVLRVEVYTNK